MINDHATKVLDAYLDTEQLSVPHAVLIEGHWGSGKTYFLQNVYEPARRERMRTERRYHTPFLFVSLFGASSASDVEMRIYKAACPGEAVAGAIAGTITLGIGEFFRVKDAAKGTVDKLGKKAIRRLSEYVFVFDDLERVEKHAFGEVMGLINSFIAEHGRRVILVTDEKKLSASLDNGLWKEQNEKIIGRRAHIEADFESVIRGAVNDLANGPAKKFMSERISELFETAQISTVKDLRNLSWAIHNTAAFINCLAADPDIPEKHTASTMHLVLASTLWMRSDLIDAEAIEQLPGLTTTLAVHSFKDNPLEAHLEKAKKFADTFLSIPVDVPPVSYEFIQEFENSGVIDQEQVIFWVKSQFGFGSDYTEPTWRKIWYSYERPITETDAAIVTLKKELQERRYTKHGQILHAAGLAIQQQNLKDGRLTNDEDVVTFFKSYIDELADSRRLEMHDSSHLSHFQSYEGLGFAARETGEFREISNYMLTKSEEITKFELRAKAEAIIEEAEAGDLEALFKFVRLDNAQLSTKPVLIDIPANRIATLITRDAPNLDVGAKLLAYRYQAARCGDLLSQELPWARDVYTAAMEKLRDWEEPY